MRVRGNLSICCWLLCLFSASTLQGCTGVRQQLLSRPIPVESQIGKDGRIDLGGAEIHIRPANALETGSGVNWFGINQITAYRTGYRSHSYYPNEIRLDQPVSRFYVEVFVKAEKDVKLDLRQVIVRSNESGAITPVSYLGPLKPYSLSNYALPLCRPDLSLENAIGPAFFISKHQSLCLALVYSMRPPLPSERFLIDLGAVIIEGKDIVIPPLEYQESQEVSFRP